MGTLARRSGDTGFSNRLAPDGGIGWHLIGHLIGRTDVTQMLEIHEGASERVFYRTSARCQPFRDPSGALKEPAVFAIRGHWRATA